MPDTESRCQRCGYLPSRCSCPDGPLLPQPPPFPVLDISKPPELLTPAEVGALFRVDPKTVTRWAQRGKVRSIRTLGGHRRYRAEDIYAFLKGDQC